jgi:hypothetical protein
MLILFILISAEKPLEELHSLCPESPYKIVLAIGETNGRSNLVIQALSYPSCLILFLLEFIGCVLQAVLTEDQLIDLADGYGWDIDEDLRFTNYEAS